MSDITTEAALLIISSMEKELKQLRLELTRQRIEHEAALRRLVCGECDSRIEQEDDGEPE